MKILWLSHIVPYPPKAGVLQRSYNMLNETAKYHEVDLLTFIQKGVFEQIYNNPEQGLKEAKDFLNNICDKVSFVPIESETSSFGKYFLAIKSLVTKNPYTINWLESKRFLIILKQWLSESNYDLVYFDTISLTPYLDELDGIPTILDHHNIESHLLLRRAGMEMNPVKKIYYYQEGVRLEKYEKKHCSKFDLNLTCSEMDSERLKKINPLVLTEEIPNGVALKNMLTEEVRFDKSILFIGTLNWDPNAKAVIYIAEKIWPLLKKKYPDVICDIIGTHPPKKLIELAKRDSLFRVHGFVSDLGEFLKPGAIFVCPIKDGGGTKLKILDALAMKAAVVADPIACEGIDVVDRENVMLASTPEEYTDKIIELFNNDVLRKSLGDNARELIELLYSYVSIGYNFSKVCKCVINKKI